MLSFLLSDHCSIVHYLPFRDLTNHAVKGRNQWGSLETKTTKGKMFSCSTILWSPILGLEVPVPSLAGGRSLCSAALSSFFCRPQSPGEEPCKKCLCLLLADLGANRGLWGGRGRKKKMRLAQQPAAWCTRYTPEVQAPGKTHVPGRSGVTPSWSCSVVPGVQRQILPKGSEYLPVEVSSQSADQNMHIYVTVSAKLASHTRLWMTVGDLTLRW